MYASGGEEINSGVNRKHGGRASKLTLGFVVDSSRYLCPIEGETVPGFSPVRLTADPNTLFLLVSVTNFNIHAFLETE